MTGVQVDFSCSAGLSMCIRCCAVAISLTFVAVAAAVVWHPFCFQSRQTKINAEAVLGRVVGAITGGKKEGGNIVDITTTIDLLQVFWEAEKARNKLSGDMFSLLQNCPACCSFVHLLVLMLREVYAVVCVSLTSKNFPAPPPPPPSPSSSLSLSVAFASGAPRLLRQEPSVAILHHECRDKARQTSTGHQQD